MRSAWWAVRGLPYTQALYLTRSRRGVCLMTEEEVRIESKREVYDSFPKLVVYVSIAILIYLFAILVFILLGHGLDIAGVMYNG